MINEKPPNLTTTPDREYREYPSFQIEAAGHRFAFYPAGAERLTALIEHIASAQDQLDLFYYEFQDDHAGGKVLDALIEALRRGVKVSLITDDFGSDAPQVFFDPLIDAGAEFSTFSADWGMRYLIRNHQKFAIADKKRVMTGGSNVSDEYYNPPSKNGWCDLGVVIEGQVVEQFADWFSLLSEWTRGSGAQLRRIRRDVRAWEPSEDPDDGDVQLLVGGPLVRRAHWSYQFKKDLSKASRLDIVTAYFGPPASFRRAMARVARRGEMRLVAAGKSDLDGTIDAARLYYKRLLKAGASISEFQPSKLHMKLMVVDDYSYFGSANLDRRSVRINVELMVRVKDAALADRLREMIDHIESASQPIDREWYAQHAGFWTRLRWRVFHWLSIADYRMSRSAKLPTRS